MELQSRTEELKRQQLGLVAISYDAPHILKKFAASRGITFPLLSDVGSRVITRFGLLNTTIEQGTRSYGVPSPGTFVVDRNGIVRSRDPQPWARVHAMTYPAPEIYHFKPLEEHVEVYQRPFRLVQDVTVLATPEAQKMLATQHAVTLTGRLEYQACDDTLCYSPQSVPVSWELPLKPLERRPPG